MGNRAVCQKQHKLFMEERWNVNRGFKDLRVWQDSIQLYVLTSKIFSGFPYELKRVAANIIDSSHSISRNIAEGYCRKSIKEYLNFLNIALGSSGEFHSSCVSMVKSHQITKEDFEVLDKLHYKIENELINLIKSLQRKLKNKDWEDEFG